MIIVGMNAITMTAGTTVPIIIFCVLASGSGVGSGVGLLETSGIVTFEGTVSVTIINDTH